MEKSFVTMEAKICSVCGQQYNSGTILLNKRLSKRFDKETVTGFGMCPEHVKLMEEGFVACIEIDSSKVPDNKDRLKQEEAPRTGRLAHVKREALEAMLGSPVVVDIVFVDEEVFEAFISAQKNAENSGNEIGE